MFNFGTLRLHLTEIANGGRAIDAKPEPSKKSVLRFVPVAGLKLPEPNGGEADFQADHITYMFNHQMPSIGISSFFDSERRIALVDYTFSVFTYTKRPLEAYFLAIHILDHTLKAQSNKIKRLPDEEIAPIIIAAVEIGSKCEILYGVAHHFTKTYGADKIRFWEREHLRIFDFNISYTHVLHFLRIYQCMTGNLMKTHLDVCWATIKGLACIAVAKSSLVDVLPSLLAAAIMRIVLELFAQRRLLGVELNSQIIMHLQHTEMEHIPPALDLLNWLLTQPKVKSITSHFSQLKVGFAKLEIEAIINKLKTREELHMEIN
ncbi:unnamed protein product, partial [Mesorhabditis belari]|uniref:Cyclin N-terminal domain-containing protein n=1 Tax=Mesorhabditis belari TaxID=2138241 RepID=A0AAF3F1M6_9BILA